MTNESTLDIENLLQEFNLPDVHTDKENLLAPIPIPKDPQPGDVENITRQNVARANRFLDMMEQELNSGGSITPKIMEAASKLIDSVSTASEILSSIELTEKTLDFKERSLDLRKYEFDAKMQQKDKQADGPEHLTQNINFFTGSREDVMALIRETTGGKTALHKQVERTLHDDDSEDIIKHE